MKKLLVLSFALLLFLEVFPQKSMNTRKWSKEDQDAVLTGQTLFQEEHYLQAIPIFQKLLEKHPKENYLKYVLGVCGLYRSDLNEQSLELLEEVYARNKKVFGIKYDLARAYHLNYKFDESIEMANSYLTNTKIIDKEKKSANDLVNYCVNGKALVAAPVDAKIENFGSIINTAASEYVPVLSADERTIIYTYVGDQSIGGLQNGFNQPDAAGIYYEDVYISRKDSNVWSTPENIGSSINTTSHDAAIAISNDGQKLFIYKDDGYDGGDIYMSTLEGDTWSSPQKLRGDVNTAAWEGSCSLTADEKTLYFSSERSGGFGGSDLYKASLMPDDTWGNVENLGPTVNTAFDDDAPFIHPDGKTLTYSSRGLNSMGGFDIFITELKSDFSWSTPKNLGYPINTTDEDRYFVLSADGNRGYYASGKKGGYGLQDIYVIEMPPGLIKPNVTLVKGITTEDNKPIKALIKVEQGEDKKPYTTLSSNSTNGNFLVNLISGHNYYLTFKLEGYPDEVRTVDARTIGYAERNINFNFVRIDSTKKDTLQIIATIDSTKAPAHTAIPGDFSLEGLEFKVQIAAYNLPKNYKYSYLKGMGKVEKLLLDDGITRFTIGGIFKSMNEATIHRNKVREAGQKDAFVTAIFKGKRVYLEDLVKMGVLPALSK